MTVSRRRRWLAEVDEMHREAMRTIRDDLGEAHFGGTEAQAGSRRSFLRRAASGAAITFGAASVPVLTMARAAGAQDTDGSAGTTPGTEPEGDAPAAGSSADAPLVEGDDLALTRFAQSVELAAAAFYVAMVDTRQLDSAAAEQARLFGRHHREHADVLGTLALSESVTEPNAALVAQLVPQIEAASDQAALVQLAYTVEEGAAATYQFALGAIESWELAAGAGRIEPVEAQHAIGWSFLIEPDVATWVDNITTYVPAFQGTTGAFAPDQYAVG